MSLSVLTMMQEARSYLGNVQQTAVIFLFRVPCEELECYDSTALIREGNTYVKIKYRLAKILYNSRIKACGTMSWAV